MAVPGLLVFSHLRWNFVYQRPQHLHSAFAARRPVLFIEEPIFDPAADPHWELREAAGGRVTVCRPHVPVDGQGFDDGRAVVLSGLLESLLAEKRMKDYIAWLYTPMALPLLEVLHPAVVVYDCMDDLASFRHAPPQLVDREAELLVRANLVFTGGLSLYEARKNRHPNVHCFPSSVDARHFGQARAGSLRPEDFEPSDQRTLPHPRLGYYGVIDERIDPAVLEQLARECPQWQIVMVGPVAKIDPATLPRASNLHYLGQRTYEDLPRYLAGWDVCLMPFALNEATRHISPTKTLEYMAAERPIVSTPIVDVVRSYSEIVYLGDTPAAFLAACERALAADAPERAVRTAKMRDVLAQTSWEATARAMEDLIDETVRRRRKVAGGRRVDFHASRQTRATRGPENPVIPPVVVVGAGPTGLSAAYHLGEDALLVERDSRVGGLCRSFTRDGFTFDAAGHIMFSADAYVHQMYRLLLGENVHWQDREAWIHSKGVYTRYPFQGSLYGLPAEVIRECLVGAIEARYGSPKPAPPGSNGRCKVSPNGNGRVVGRTRETALDDCCGDGVLESTAPLGQTETGKPAAGEPRNFEEFIYRVWGAGIARHFAIPYNRKLWAVDLREMETSWLGGRVPLPDLEEMIDGALRPSPKPMGPNARFGYPLRGGFQALMDGFLPLLRGPLWLNRSVAAVSPSRHTVTLDDGRIVPYERLISTMPLPILVRSMGEEAPPEVRHAAAALRHVSVRCVHLGVGRENLTEKHWIYYPEDTVFHRIFVQGNASPHCNPPGGFGLTCEITYSPDKPLPCDGETLVQLAVDDCRRVGIIGGDDPILTAFQVDIPHAYVVYDHQRPRHVATARGWLESRDILLAGRYSEWEYYNSDHAFLAGKRAAERCAHGARSAVTLGKE